MSGAAMACVILFNRAVRGLIALLRRLPRHNLLRRVLTYEIFSDPPEHKR